MIDRTELHDWLIDEIHEQQLDAPEDVVRTVAYGAVNAYLALGQRFGLFSSDEEREVCKLLDAQRSRRNAFST